MSQPPATAQQSPVNLICPQFLPSASRNWIGSREDRAGAARVRAITRARAGAWRAGRVACRRSRSAWGRAGEAFGATFCVSTSFGSVPVDSGSVTVVEERVAVGASALDSCSGAARLAPSAFSVPAAASCFGETSAAVSSGFGFRTTVFGAQVFTLRRSVKEVDATRMAPTSDKAAI